jgi:ATP-dependent Clp protease ATP-binding subunit ClpA
VFERFAEPASLVMCRAYEESDRLRHDYVGPEHVLVGLARQEDSRAAAILAGSGLGPDAIRAGLDHLVAAGALPAPWRNQADLLASVGIDLAAVRRATEETFGADAVCAASRRARSRSWLRAAPMVSVGPVGLLSGKALLTKRAFELARQAADGLGQHEVATEHLLAGVLRDAQDPLGTGLSRPAKRMGSSLGLRPGAPSPVRQVIEGAGVSLELLRGRVLAELRGAA